MLRPTRGDSDVACSNSRKYLLQQRERDVPSRRATFAPDGRNGMSATHAEPTKTSTTVSVIDADIHVNPRSAEELQDYMPDPWRTRGLHELLLSRTVPTTSVVYNAPNEGRRLDSFGPSGPPGSDPEFTAQQLFRDAGVDY